MKRLLFITTRPPYPATKGDQIVAWNRIKALSQTYQIHLLCFYTKPIDLEDRWQMEKYCEKVIAIRHFRLKAFANLCLGIFGSLPLQIGLYFDREFAHQIRMLKETYKYEAVHAVLLRLYSYVQASADETVFELVDSMALNLGSQIPNAKGLRKLLLKIEFRRIKRLEEKIAEKFRGVLVVSHRDRQALGVSQNIHSIPNGTDVSVIRPKERPEGRAPTIAFVGNMNYAPNEEAVNWFLIEVWPLILKLCPQAQFLIVGRDPSKATLALSRKVRGVQVTGAVPSVEPYLLSSDLFVAPMRSGSGMQNKIIEAMATAIPVVTTSVGAAGFEGRLAGVLVHDDAESFCKSVVDLLGDDKERERLGQAAQLVVDSRYRWRQSNRKLLGLYKEFTVVR